MDVVLARKKKLFPQLTDADFAAMIGITHGTFCDYKAKDKTVLPSLPVALMMALVLKLDLRKLVANADEILNQLKQRDSVFFARS